MRVIAGTAKGLKLFMPDEAVTRPTTERAKEAGFSMIQFDIEGRKILDLFAGSGQMGIEALSRGAEFACFVDSSSHVAKIINSNIEKARLFSQCKIVCSDVIDFLRSADRSVKFDIVFIDPPYACDMIEKVLGELYKSEIIKDTTVIICENNKKIELKDESVKNNYKLLKYKNYGIAHFTFFTPEM